MSIWGGLAKVAGGDLLQTGMNIFSLSNPFAGMASSALTKLTGGDNLMSPTEMLQKMGDISKEQSVGHIRDSFQSAAGTMGQDGRNIAGQKASEGGMISGMNQSAISGLQGNTAQIANQSVAQQNMFKDQLDRNTGAMLEEIRNSGGGLNAAQLAQGARGMYDNQAAGAWGNMLKAAEGARGQQANNLANISNLFNQSTQAYKQTNIDPWLGKGESLNTTGLGSAALGTAGQTTSQTSQDSRFGQGLGTSATLGHMGGTDIWEQMYKNYGGGSTADGTVKGNT
jgi:hypothetical protein